tara:strand:+ start:37 stop:198 length:162 start_codon:yes stop_codon:yes gene_type:complete
MHIDQERKYDACDDQLLKEVIQGRINDFEAFQACNPEVIKEPDSDSSCLKAAK